MIEIVLSSFASKWSKAFFKSSLLGACSAELAGSGVLGRDCASDPGSGVAGMDLSGVTAPGVAGISLASPGGAGRLVAFAYNSTTSHAGTPSSVPAFNASATLQNSSKSSVPLPSSSFPWKNFETAAKGGICPSTHTSALDNSMIEIVLSSFASKWSKAFFKSSLLGACSAEVASVGVLGRDCASDPGSGVAGMDLSGVTAPGVAGISLASPGGAG